METEREEMAVARSDRDGEKRLVVVEPVGEKELSLSFQNGQEGAYEAIYERYVPRISNLCNRMLRDSHEAEDATQETFLRVYQALPRFNGRYQLGAWITRIATNVCLDKIKAQTRRHQDAAPLEKLQELDLADGGDNPEELVLHKAEINRFIGSLGALSPLQRRAVLLRDFEGLAYGDIAVKLGISECRVRVLMHRARKALQSSWSSAGIAVSLSGRLLGRLRRLRGAVVDEAGRMATSAGHIGHIAIPAEQTASSCAMVQHCGGIIMERVATAMTVAVVGIATAGGAVGSADRLVNAVTSSDRQVRAAGSNEDILALGGTGIHMVATDAPGEPEASATAIEDTAAVVAPTEATEVVPATEVLPPTEVTEPLPVEEPAPSEEEPPPDYSDPATSEPPDETPEPTTDDDGSGDDGSGDDGSGGDGSGDDGSGDDGEGAEDTNGDGVIDERDGTASESGTQEPAAEDTDDQDTAAEDGA